ncbi:lipoate--protein ligase family protein [Halorubrum sp. GN11_10-6_MGM]|uniref:lipoate--protein ligase family protein n=1 Tax=Halorubrum sp. GN11_10-6_MGM TaxID=2518112 RepID=UPI0010F7AB30|nr:biotin/lipoate A/B protein ligase family protein [Halorubrum sp. GN11_10-6_MGM]TKX73742.1 lipoate--protein ligase family protein [Halorubrum sp. GN11_10-6_MGM]
MTAPAVDWQLIREEARPGPMQMALDEVAAETAAAGGPATVRTYRWEPSCLTLGRHQDPETVDWAFCEREGIDVTRRQTGGGGIYHDGRGDIAYSIAVPADTVPGELLDCYHLLCEPVLDAFDRLGIDADYVDESVPALYHPACYLRELHPAHDVVARVGNSGDADDGKEAGDGRKIAGNAQYRKREAVIQHGSLTFSVDAGRHLGVFADPPVTPGAFRERVVGMDELVDVDRADAVAAVEAALLDWAGAAPDATVNADGSWTDAELERAEEIAAEKYRSEAWVRTRPGSRTRET